MLLLPAIVLLYSFDSELILSSRIPISRTSILSAASNEFLARPVKTKLQLSNLSYARMKYRQPIQASSTPTRATPPSPPKPPFHKNPSPRHLTILLLKRLQAPSTHRPTPESSTLHPRLRFLRGVSLFDWHIGWILTNDILQLEHHSPLWKLQVAVLYQLRELRAEKIP